MSGSRAGGAGRARGPVATAAGCLLVALGCLGASWRWLLADDFATREAAAAVPLSPPHPSPRAPSPSPPRPPVKSGLVGPQRTFSDARGFHKALIPPAYKAARESMPVVDAGVGLAGAYFPPLPPHLQPAATPCQGVAARPVGAARRVPPGARYLLLADAWEAGQSGLTVLEHVIELCLKFGLVLVTPFVRDTYIQGLPGWTQWKAHELHDYNGFSPARGLEPLGAYLDVPYTRQFVPILDFHEFCALSNFTITTAVQVDWMSRKCEIRPEWYPAYGARLQATQFLCIPPHRLLGAADIDDWYTPGRHPPLAEAEGRGPTVPAVVLLNWRMALNGIQPAADACRLRANPRWNITAVEFAGRILPERYVAVRLKGGPLLRYPQVKGCFEAVTQAVQYYAARLGHGADTPVLLSTDWPVLPEGRWNFGGMTTLTAEFNRLHRRFNLQQFRDRSLDAGVEALVQMYLLANAAVVIVVEDPLLQLMRQYSALTPIALLGNAQTCGPFTPPRG